MRAGAESAMQCIHDLWPSILACKCTERQAGSVLPAFGLLGKKTGVPPGDRYLRRSAAAAPQVKVL